MPLFNQRSEAAEVVRGLRRQWLSLFTERLPKAQADLTAIRQLIQLNESGDFEAGDLALFDAVVSEMITAARDYTDGLPDPP